MELSSNRNPRRCLIQQLKGSLGRKGTDAVTSANQRKNDAGNTIRAVLEAGHVFSGKSKLPRRTTLRRVFHEGENFIIHQVAGRPSGYIDTPSIVECSRQRGTMIKVSFVDHLGSGISIGVDLILYKVVLQSKSIASIFGGIRSMTMSEPLAGTDWQPDELDAIIADYFDMLAADLAGIPYVKSRHRESLMSRLGRSNGSIEFKYQNISAVLDKLGSPWIHGYKPAKNYQSALFEALDRYLETRPAGLDLPTVAAHSLPGPNEVFVQVPDLAINEDRIPKRLQELVRKYDPVERDRHNRSLGKAGEAFVYDLEQRRLHAADRADLARKVRWVADVDGDGAGYDVLSFGLDGSERLLEVKTTNGSARTPFFISRKECEVAAERSDHWRLYRVHTFANSPRVFVLSPPLATAINLTAEVWHASF